ncbi:MAG: hypothetical protein HOQ05_13990 [Corynebacteriales bacterium]|nr:hypothetical protein [Mycobacteriales bacterium]
MSDLRLFRSVQSELDRLVNSIHLVLEMHRDQKLQALLSAITPPDSVLQDWRARFDALVMPLKNSELLPSDEIAIRTFINRYEWEFFAKPGENFPSTQLMVTDGRETTVHNTFLGGRYDTIEYSDLSDHFQNFFSEIIEERNTYLFGTDGYADNDNEIEAATRAILVDSPQYRLFKLLAMPSPLLEEAPLTLADRQLIENNLRESILGPLRDSPERHAAPGFAAERVFKKQMHSLDEQTKPQIRPASDPRNRIYNWLLQQARNGWSSTPIKSSLDDDRVEKIAVQKNGNSYEIVAEYASGKIDNINELVNDWSSDELPCEPRDLLYGTIFSSLLGYEFVRQFLRDDTTPPEQILDTVVGELAEGWAWAGHWDNLSDDEIYAILISLRRPQGPMCADVPESGDFGTIPESYISQPNRQEESQNTTGIQSEHFLRIQQEIKATVLSREQIEERKNITIGRVLSRDYQDQFSRLIIGQSKARKYPEISDQAQHMLVVEFEESLDDTTEPYIPGYVTTANSGKQWAFRRSAVDLHKGAHDVVIPRSGLAELVDAYGQLGLPSLAQALSKLEKTQGFVSADDLQKLISAHSVYTYDKANELHPTALQGFSHCIRKGRLHVQCTGAASFLAMSLRLAMPDCRATIHTGLTLSDDDRIHGLEHAQVALKHGNRLYLLDATPPSNLRGMARLKSFMRTRRAGFRNAQPSAPAVDPLTEHVPDPAEFVETITSGELVEHITPHISANVVVQLEEIMRPAFNVTTNADLYRAILNLPKRDPIRIAMEAGKQRPGTRGASAMSYLEKYSNDADHRDRIFKLTGRKYDPRFTALLVDCLRPLTAIQPEAPTIAHPKPQALAMPQVSQAASHWRIDRA